MGAPIWTCKQTLKRGVETLVITQDQEIQTYSLYHSDVGTI
jgi:hypothetical protein